MARNRVPGGLARALEDYLTQVGYWQGSRRETHDFVLSPDLCLLSLREQEQLDEISRGVRTYLGALEEALKRLSDTSPNDPAWGMFRKFAHAGARNVFAEAQQRWDVSAPWGGVYTPGVKLDLVRERRGFKIVEIDGWNPRGMTFSPLIDELADVVRRMAAAEGCLDESLEAPGYGGVIPAMTALLRSRGQSRLFILVSAKESFYRPVYELFARALRVHGVEVTLFDEGRTSAQQLLARLREDPTAALYAVPEMPRSNMDRVLLQGIDDPKRVVFPPKPLWSSKGVLALLTCPPDWARDVFAQIGYSDEDRLQLAQHVPRTWFPSASDRLPLIKAVHSSGSHGVTFPDASMASYMETHERLTRGRMTLDQVFQELASLKHVRYRYFTQEGHVVKASDFRERLIVHVAGCRALADAIDNGSDGVLDADITARRDDNVHGQADALMLQAVRSSR